jgi:OPA family sugar phosphate sensor protein UhpC-like MFS transporter
MTNPLRFFEAGLDKPLITEEAVIDRLFRRQRISVLLTITLGYAFVYTCRLGLSVVKKPLIDGGIFSASAVLRLCLWKVDKWFPCRSCQC